MPRVTTRTKAPAKAKPNGGPSDTGTDLDTAIAQVEDDTPSRSSDDLFPSLEDAPEWLRILWYGREGSGKTTDALLATVPAAAAGSKILVINAEGGLKVKALQRHGVDPSLVRLWPNPNRPVPITHRRLDRLYRTIKADLMADPNSWYAVVFDSGTDIVESMVGFIGDKRVAKAREGGLDIDEIDAFATDRNDYGTMSKMFRDILRKFRDLPCHILITALERRDEDEDTKRVMYGPAVSPGIQSSLLGYVDIVLATKAEDETSPFRALTRKSARHRAKDRFGILPEVLVDPTFPRVLAYYNGELTEDTDPEQKRLPVKRSGKKGKAQTEPEPDMSDESDESDEEDTEDDDLD